MSAKTATRNGKAPVEPAEEAIAAPDVEFPVDSFRDAAPHLRRPFTVEAVKFKVQATWPKGDPHSGLIVSYIDARLAIERLNLVCPHLWHDEYESPGKGLMWCRLTVDGITRHDVGEGEKKGLVSDALKRAAVKFGVGVSLYATPKIILATKDGHLRADAKGSLLMTPSGEARCRDLYGAWLDMQGRQAFGDPLDHGDALDAVGDSEADPEMAPAEGASAAPSGPVVDPDRAGQIGHGIKALGLKRNDIDALWGLAGLDRIPDERWNAKGIVDALNALTVPQAEVIEQALENRAAKAEADAAAEAAEEVPDVGA